MDSFWSPEATSRSQSFEEARSFFSFAPLPEQTEVNKEGATPTEHQRGFTQVQPGTTNTITAQEQNRDTGQVEPRPLNKSLNDKNNQTVQQDDMDFRPYLIHDEITTNQAPELPLSYGTSDGRTQPSIPLTNSSPSILETYPGLGISDPRMTTKADHQATRSQYAFQTNLSYLSQERTHQARSASDSGITTSSGSSSTPAEAGKQEADVCMMLVTL